jgi:hypothetical protein
MGARVEIPCMIPFSGDRLRTPTGRHRWRDEEYQRIMRPSALFSSIEVVVMDARCVFCRRWRGDVIEPLRGGGPDAAGDPLRRHHPRDVRRDVHRVAEAVE